MRIKSFFAASVDLALGAAREELGPEAMLVQSRPAPPEARHLGDYEVVCALLPSEAVDNKAASRNRETALPREHAEPSNLDRLTRDLNELRGAVQSLRASVAAKPATPSPAEVESDPLQPVLDILLRSELDRDLVNEIAAEAR